MSTARTDNDTWDLATSVGATATMVAAGRARATNAGLIDDPFAEPLVRAVGIDFFTRWATGALNAEDVDTPGAPWGMQPMTNLLTVRTRYFDTFFTDALDVGIRQLVILASGLDARGYRMAWPADTVIFEIDQPEVLAFKAATLTAMNAEPTADVRSVAIDLRHDWPTALREAGFNPAQRSAWIAEGLLPFLPSDAQDRLLDNITALSAEGSRLASEVAHFTPEDDEAEARTSMESVTQRWRDAGFDLEFGELGFAGERNDVAAYLDGLGWRSVLTTSEQLLTGAGLPAIPRIAGMRSIGDNYYGSSVKK